MYALNEESFLQALLSAFVAFHTAPKVVRYVAIFN